MIRGLYSAASGMGTQLIQQDVIANNLANVNTTGYKKDTTVVHSFGSMLLSRVNDSSDIGSPPGIGQLGEGVRPAMIHTDMSQGALQRTENPFDLAVSGNGFFVVQTAAGERYTRDGSFSVNPNGDLVTQNGDSVMGLRGAVNVGSARNVQINEDGSVVADNQVINELRIVEPGSAGAFQKIGSNLYGLVQGGQLTENSPSKIMQGYLESSNVNTVSEMVRMISGLRLYETNQRSIQSQDETLQQLINTVARI